MPRFDPDVMLKLVTELRKSVRQLERLSGLDQKKFLVDPDKIGSAKYNFITAIESCIDMCNHAISQNSYRVPDDYADTFRVMAEEGMLSASFSEELMKMAKFRNRLVHLYWEVDDRKLHDILTTCLPDFGTFLKCMSDHLGWDHEPSDL